MTTSPARRITAIRRKIEEKHDALLNVDARERVAPHDPRAHGGAHSDFLHDDLVIEIS